MTAEVFLADKLLQVDDSANMLSELNLPVADNGDACRVISSIFQFLKSLDNYALRRVITYITYDSAHNISSNIFL